MPAPPLLRRPSLLVVLLAAALAAPRAGAQPTDPREAVRLDDWRFALGHASDPAQDFGHGTGYFSYLAKTGFGDGPANPAFDDRAWREVTVPHDWAVEAPFSPQASPSHGFKAVGPGFPERSVGWYRTRVFVPEGSLGRRVALEFEGVYRDADVFVNGFFVGNEPSGYLDQFYDVTEYLDYGAENVVAVRVDASMEEGWFYEGAGIYRPVRLHTYAPLHVGRHGVWAHTTVDDDRATVYVDVTVANEHAEAQGYRTRLTIEGPDGSAVATHEGARQSVEGLGQRTVTDTLAVAAPRLWSLDDPALHTAVVEVLDDDGALVDRVRQPFGIRTVRFDPDRGFFLNGEHVVLKGTNNHHDHAGVGVAIPDALREWRLRRLKSMGANAYRVAHQQPAPALLDLCDRLGILVIDETRLMGTSDYHLSQLERLIRRDRNHPSVVLWSLGNEEWRIEGNVLGARIAERMQAFARTVDSTRIYTAAISGGWGGTSTVVEAAGVNYIRQADTDRQHAEYPWQIILGTEETTTQATRGVYVEDAAQAHLPPQEDGSSGGNAEVGWQHYAARPYAAGVFYWTGFDYRGEPTPYGWPGIGSQFGILDTAGFPKDSYHYLRAWWTDEPVLHVFPHWNWPGREGETVEVRAHSNHDAVELFLNGESLGRQTMPTNGHLAWDVVYQPGVLRAVGYRDGEVVQETAVETTGAPAAVELEADRAAYAADGRDVAVVTVRVVDAEGRVVPTAGDEITFHLDGPGRIIGVGNGDPSSHEPDQFVEAVEARPIGAWTAPNPADAETPVRWEATFDAPDLPAGSGLLLNALGRRQSVTLNGQTLLADAGPDEARTEVALAGLPLRPTGNRLVITAQPFQEWRDRENTAEVHPAMWRVVTPPRPWQRRVFNGLAQVLVQTTDRPGVVRLRATGDAVGSDVLQLTTTADHRP